MATDPIKPNWFQSPGVAGGGGRDPCSADLYNAADRTILAGLPVGLRDSNPDFQLRVRTLHGYFAVQPRNSLVSCDGSILRLL